MKNKEDPDMKSTTVVVIISLMMLLVWSCKDYSMDNDVELQTLKTWMVGSFNSLEQSEVDTNYFNIHLEMVQVWPDARDAIYLYVEQAASWALERPYRQRVYRLSRDETGVLESEVYMLESPLRFTGAWKLDQPLGTLTPDSVSIKEGCAIKLELKGEAFDGGTVGKDCISSLRGAAYATSKVNVTKNTLTSWDQGFDSTGVQVWGAIDGPYIFKKVK